MKHVFLFLTCILLSTSAFSQVGIGTENPDASAVLDLTSTTKGLLPPRMTAVERDAIVVPAQGLMIYCTDCGANGEIQFFNGAAWVNVVGGVAAAAPPQIGDLRDGGIVFYVAPTPIDLNGDGIPNIGLVTAVSDQSSGTPWGCPNTAHFSTLTGIGQGAQNTNAIDAGCATPGIAADICANLDLNGYTDWFLPSRDELNLMFINRGDINTTAVSNGGSTFAGGGAYWSSYELSSPNVNNAWVQYFGNGHQSYHTKNTTNRVRAVRAF